MICHMHDSLNWNWDEQIKGILLSERERENGQAPLPNHKPLSGYLTQMNRDRSWEMCRVLWGHWLPPSPIGHHNQELILRKEDTGATRQGIAAGDSGQGIFLRQQSSYVLGRDSHFHFVSLSFLNRWKLSDFHSWEGEDYYTLEYKISQWQ